MSLFDGRLLQAAMREDFPTFLHRCFLHLNPGERYSANWHIQAIGYRLDGVRRDQGARLIVTVPPRSLKSIAISVAWVAWMLGKDPSLTFVCVSYSADLSLKHARDCRAILQSDWYRALFPRTVLKRVPENDFETTAGGGRISTSVGGTLTGRGGDIIIIDDPIKPDEAASEPTRRAAIEWFRSTLITRLNDKLRGSIILVMQRLHEEDLAGYLLEASGWDHLNLPAIATCDEAIPIVRANSKTGGLVMCCTPNVSRCRC